MKSFFAKYWILYYIIFFLLLGVLVYSLIKLKSNHDLHSKINHLEEKVNDCCNAKENISDDVDRIRENEGNIGELTVTLIWNSIDDLDLALREPSGEMIYYKKFNSRDNLFSPNGGQLDVDMNVDELSIEPVENINYENNLVKGKYFVFLNLYEKRSNRPVEYQLIVRKNKKIIHSITGKVEKVNHLENILSFEI
jgi:hypothetical protein